MIPIDNMVLKRRDSSIRGDREMTFGMMKEKISEYEKKINFTKDRIRSRLLSEAKKFDIDSRLDSSVIISPLLAALISLSFISIIVKDMGIPLTYLHMPQKIYIAIILPADISPENANHVKHL